MGHWADGNDSMTIYEAARVLYERYRYENWVSSVKVILATGAPSDGIYIDVTDIHKARASLRIGCHFGGFPVVVRLAERARTERGQIA